MFENKQLAEQYTILVVDDDDLLNFLFQSLLESKGFLTCSASSLSQAREVIKSGEKIDLILLDYQLGDGVGVELLDGHIDVGGQPLPPVIMISANEEPEFLEVCFQKGVKDYIIKPVNMSLLVLKVETVIRSIRLQTLIEEQNLKLAQFKSEAEREEQVAQFTYEYLLKQNSSSFAGIDVWRKSFAAFSGDLVLVKKSPGGSLFFMLVDATGHGLSAAITIMPLVTLFNSMTSRGFHLQQIVTEINKKLVSDTPDDRFVAALLVEVLPYTREVHVWNGGMPTAYWVQSQEIVAEFPSTHMSLGILNDDMFDANVQIISLPREGFLFAYSDGLNEQENEAGQPYGLSAIKNVLQSEAQNTVLQKIESSLIEHAGKNSFTDDVSACVVSPWLALDGELHKISAQHQVRITDDIHPAPFTWAVRLIGQQLHHNTIPYLLNSFIQQMGLDHQFCQRIFAVVAEMSSNALDHGVLQLDSALKDSPEGFVAYMTARDEKLNRLTDADFIDISVNWYHQHGAYYLSITVEDSGAGYDFANLAKCDAQNGGFSGRGCLLIKNLSENFEIFPPGNKIRATLKL